VPAPALVARWLACPVAAAAEICAQAACILAQPALQQFFDPARLLSADNECEMVVSGAVMRIDRLVQHADGFWILDYKRSVDSADLPAYAAQLGAYRRAMFAAGCRLPIKTALISADGRLWCVD
jgi:ATP-dependent helicase/nuclease subunit A